MITTNFGRKPTRLLSTALVAGFLTACGGGGGGGDTTAPPIQPPPTSTFSIGGNASGVNGTGLVLQNNGGDNLSVTASGSFTFATAVDDGATYDVTVLTQPSNPEQSCSVTNGSGTATANVTNVSVSCADVSAVDTDGDGISDDDERTIYGTNWDDDDTDGDGYTDGDEIQTFDPSVNNFRFNPVVADVPEIRIEIQDTPVIGANITESQSSAVTESTTRAQSTSNTSSTTFGASTTLGVEASQSATVGASTTGPSAEVETSVKVTAEATVSFDATTTNENREAWERMRGRNIESSSTVTDGFINVGVNIVNTGHLSLSIEALDLIAVRVNDGEEPFTALGTLVRDTAFTPISLAAGQSISNLLFQRDGLNLQEVRSLLTDTRSLKLEQGVVTVVDTSDESVNLQAQDINRRTAKIVLDYGPYAQTEFYRTSTNIVPGQPGRSLGDIMRDSLRVPFNEDGTGLITVRDLSSSVGRWVITQKRTGDTETEITTFDPQDGNYSLDDIDVRAFDEVLLVLLEDEDNDGIGYREELLHGTDPTSADTDSDGRSDFEEIRESWVVNAINQEDPLRYEGQRISSSPTVADYDNDGLSDAEEFARLLDPYNADTDGDGTPDNMDRNNGGEPLFTSLKVLLGRNPAQPTATPFDVEVSGVISAEAPRVVETANFDWESDGGVDEPFNTAPGGSSQINVAQIRNTYPGAGTFTISLDANDDDSPVNTLNETATVTTTVAEPRPDEGFGYAFGYRLGVHLRKTLDLNLDGYDDLIIISNNPTLVSFGSPNGLVSASGEPMGFDVWANNQWTPASYPGLETDPRLFADLDNDGDLDIVGVDASENTVSYGLNNGSGFDDPVEWITGIDWNQDRDQAFLADVDNNGFIDFVHASAEADGVVAYTRNGSALDALTRGTATPLAAIDIDRQRYPAHVIDINADDCADVVIFAETNTLASLSECNGSFGPYLGFNALSYSRGYRVGITKRWIEDMTGDGLPDFVGAGGNVVIMYVNQSSGGSFDFSGRVTLSDDFGSETWSDRRTVDGRPSFGVYPRYLADVNGDDFPDIVGFGGAGAAIGINKRGIDGTDGFEDLRFITPAFNVDDPSWYIDYTGPRPTSGCTASIACRDYGPRIVGDIDGDSRADMLGFDDRRITYQSMPYVSQFE